MNLYYGRSRYYFGMFNERFHQKAPFSFIDKVLNTIIVTPQHRYQLLTKRSARLAKYFETRIVPENVWLGVTVKTQAAKDRIDMLRATLINLTLISVALLFFSFFYGKLRKNHNKKYPPQYGFYRASRS